MLRHHGVKTLARPDPELFHSLKERTNLSSAEPRTYDNWGGAVQWQPGPRTLVSLDADRRSFGNAHNVTLRWQKPNIQNKRIYVPELKRWVRLKVSTRALRSINRVGRLPDANEDNRSWVSAA